MDGSKILDIFAKELDERIDRRINDKLNIAEYDKSYNAIILGVNQDFTDDVTEEEQQTLINKYSIPEVPDKDNYYTFKINGNYYVKTSNTHFKLYEKVIIRVPNGSWDNMYIEVQRDTIPENNGNSSETSLLSAVSFDKNRLYYNGETYHVQFGFNRRIMCVTKGEKYALINSEGYTESRIEAATAVMKGLTEDWDLEFDYYALKDTVKVADIVSGYSGAVKCDWGDGTVDEEASHTYSVDGMRVKVRIKLLDDISGQQTINTYWIKWAMSNNPYYVNGIGASLYIGGKFEDIKLFNYNWVTHVCYGENIKIVRGSRSSTSKCEKRYELGIPPCIENFANESFTYNAVDYIYIPETCIRIGDYAFSYNAASEIEIEEKGEELIIGTYAFSYTTSYYSGYNKVDIAHVPSRVVTEKRTIFPYCGATSLRIGRGTTEIPSYVYSDMITDVSAFSDTNPFFIFLPDSLKNIGAGLVPDRKTYIIYEGRSSDWSEVTKDSDWGGDNDNVTVICDSQLYESYENVIKSYVRR